MYSNIEANIGKIYASFAAKFTHPLRQNSRVLYGIFLFSILLCLAKSVSLHIDVTNQAQLGARCNTLQYAMPITQYGQYYAPSLYPQVPNVFNFAHNTTWYATSAYMDMRPQGYGDLPTVIIVTAGPVKEVQAGTKWHARLFVLHTGSVVMDLNCGTSKYTQFDQHSSKHASAYVNCKPARNQWEALRAVRNELGICLYRATFCDHKSIVPVGLPPRYPSFPLSWADTYVSKGYVPISRHDVQAQKEYLAGKGRIAMCVPGVRGDDYAETIHFFLRYYQKLGVDTVNLYMHSPGIEFARIVETIAAKQETGSPTDFPRLVLLPWCVQLGASYGCRQGQPVSPFPGYLDFVGTNHGQVLAHQDCLHRSIGTFRWVLFVDLDEYVLPKRQELLSLHDIVKDSAFRNEGVAPAELLMRTAFFENCLPSGANASVPLSPSIDPSRLPTLPRPAWSAARVSQLYPGRIRTKYMCNPHECDRVGVHFDTLKFGSRNDFVAKAHRWPASGKTYVVPEHDAIIHHARVRDRSGRESSPECHLVKRMIEQDWGMTNFAVNLGLV
jgi:hypothetical protein